MESEWECDALMVCNGHYSDPRVPDLPGCSSFPGRLLHTHNFRENGPYQGLRVVVMGAAASGQDIARDIAEVAETVRLSGQPVICSPKSSLNHLLPEVHLQRCKT